MGRQIVFFMSHEVESKFIDFIFEKSFVLLCDNRELQRVLRICGRDEIDTSPMYILSKPEYGTPLSFFDKKGESYGINHSISPVIEFSRSSVNENKKWVYSGRLWIPSEYQLKSYDDFELFTKDYNMLVRWIKKHVPYQEVKEIHPLTDEAFFHKEYISDELMPLLEQGYTLM